MLSTGVTDDGVLDIVPKSLCLREVNKPAHFDLMCVAVFQHRVGELESIAVACRRSAEVNLKKNAFD